MKFIDINSVRGLEIDQPVFTKDAQGFYGFGRLIEEKKTVDGIERTFLMAEFSDEPGDQTASPRQTNITHVCIPK